MSTDLPLRAAAHRLRRRPGRKPGSKAPAREADAPLQVPVETTPAEPVVPALCPPPETPGRRLLDLQAASVYLGGVSTWTLREWVRVGLIPVVRISLPLTGRRGAPFRKLLLDVRDLDALIAKSKVHCPEPEPAQVERMAGARAAK